ncbi:MAG TPA: YraN family protein [Saprospiraceae bacterium]|nr:YraN family protein [Saprospiraceae bacterium]
MKNKSSDNRSKGNIAEDIAFQYLLKLDYKIREINWIKQKAEIDLIAEKENILVFIEVKSRKNSDFGNPATMVTKRKQRLLVSAATQYMDSINYDGNFRFDIITVTGYDLTRCSLDHFEDAFFPGLDF